MKHLNKKEWKKTTKYIAGSTGAVALAVASCVTGVSGGADVAQPGNTYLAGDETATDGDATIVNTDDLADQLAENVNLEEKDVDKDETVYVFADANGAVDNILVNETLKNRDGSDTIEDETELSDIVNIKGDETFTQDGNKITWNAGGNAITYQGTTDKELPVSVAATYYLDGEEIAPADLAGKSGKVTIRMDYTCNEQVTKEVNGKDEDITVPFVAISGMVLGDNFSNIEVTNGKYIEQGDNTIVVGYAIPGLDDGVKDAADDLDTEIPEYVEVSADVTDFSLDMTVTLLVNGSEMNVSGDVDLSDLDELVDDLGDAGDQLADGSSELSDGASTLADKMGELSDGAGTLKSGMDSLSGSSGSLVSGISTINQSAQSIASGINALDSAVKTQMSDTEKQQIASSVSETVSASVAAQFAEGTDTYNSIYSQAADSYANTINNETTINQLYQSYLASEAYTAFYNSALASQAASQASTNAPAVAAQLMAANAELDYATAYSTAYTQVYQAAMANTELQNAVATSVQGAFYQIAQATAAGLAESGKDSVGKSVVSACESAATTAATTAAAQGAITGAETAKSTIAAQIEATQANGYSLVSGANALAQGTATLSGSVPALEEGIAQLVSGANSLADGASQLKDGAVELSDGAGTLSSSLAELNNDAIKKMIDAYNGDVKDTVERLQAAIEAATEYDSYAGISEGTSGVTKFIVKTAAISADED